MTAQTRYDLNAVFLLVLLGAATAADAQVQPQLAQRYFDEATKLCERDAGRCGVCRSVVRCNADCGVLRAADGSTLSVPVTGPLEGTTLQGDGWSATVNSGWVVRPAARPGSFTIVRENKTDSLFCVTASGGRRIQRGLTDVTRSRLNVERS